MDNSVKHLLEFGPFRIDPEQRLLLRGELPIPLSPKAFDLLLALTQRDGQVVVKDDLMKLLWPDTFVEESNLAQHIFQLRKALGERAQDSAYIVTVPGRGYRFAQKVRSIPATVAIPDTALEREEDFVVRSHSRSRVVIEESSALVKLTPPGSWNKAMVAAALAIVATLGIVATASVAYFLTHRTPKLTIKDTVVLADFANRTGDPVFDGTLRQGLLAQLQQSPFLNLLPDQSVAQTLALMTKPKDVQLTAEVAREVCQRTASSAVLDGSISQIGTRYLLTLNATNCSTAETLSSSVAQAADKNHVLDALGKIASETRRKLGESLASVQKYDVAPESVTTPSLEALQAYSLGRRAEGLNRGAEAVSLYQRSVSLDPNFASAYEGLGVDYFNHDESSQAADNVRKAYQLRERVSERERLGIEAFYYALVLGDCEGARKSLVLATRVYPRQSSGFTNLGGMENCLGHYDQGLAAHLEAMKLTPGAAKSYSNLFIAYLFLNRLDQAMAVAREAESRKLGSSFLDDNLYLLEFLRHDSGGMQREVSEALKKSDSDDLILSFESDTAAYGGHFVQARELTKRAEEAASRSGHKGTVPAYEAEAAVREALVGNLDLAKRQAKDALALGNGPDVETLSAAVLAMAGASADVARLVDDLAKRYPENTPVQYNSLPVIRASAALQRGGPEKAIESLAAAKPYELGQTGQEVSLVLFPIYVRGEAYLVAGNGVAAAAEFQKMLAWPGLVQNELIGPLAHLGLGRAYAISDDGVKARAEYQDFLTLWKDADPGLPVLKKARAEYAKLR
jgi:DNA-binding winged helix-turn-helix (wHTH) protein/tetratricopeptide (TPR) repeat protein